MMEKQILLGNNLDVLKTFPDNYFDSIVTDPPYGLGKEPNPEEVLRGWLESDHHKVKGGGFMSHAWDSFVPSPSIWKEALRVLKPGGYVLSFFGTRTYDWGVMAMRLAGFEIKDSLTWAYGSGFPKSHNVSRAIDEKLGFERPTETKSVGDINNARYAGKETSPRVLKEVTINEPISELAKKWNGFGTALKPATEPIVLARKPLENGLTIAENVMKWGTGAINIDGCRVPFENQAEFEELQQNRMSVRTKREGDVAKGFGMKPEGLINSEQNENGRWPANLLLSHHIDCNNAQCHEDCPAGILDKQSGTLKSGAIKSSYIAKESENNHMSGKNYEHAMDNRNASSGGASRFFYCAKASKREKNRGCENIVPKKLDHAREHGQAGTDNAFNRGATVKTNSHPTVKPLGIIRHLTKLITPPQGTCLDLFAGSGTTGIACELEGFGYVLIDMEPDYVEIAKARIAAWRLNPELEEPDYDETEKDQTTPKQKSPQLGLF